MKKLLFFAIPPVLFLTLIMVKIAHAWHANADARCYNAGGMSYAAASAGAGGGLERNFAKAKARMWDEATQQDIEYTNQTGPTEGTIGASAYALRIGPLGTPGSAYAYAEGYLLVDGEYKLQSDNDWDCH